MLARGPISVDEARTYVYLSTIVMHSKIVETTLDERRKEMTCYYCKIYHCTRAMSLETTNQTVLSIVLCEVCFDAASKIRTLCEKADNRKIMMRNRLLCTLWLAETGLGLVFHAENCDWCDEKVEAFDTDTQNGSYHKVCCAEANNLVDRRYRNHIGEFMIPRMLLIGAYGLVKDVSRLVNETLCKLYVETKGGRYLCAIEFTCA